VEFTEDKSVIEKEMLKKGMFIVATNELDSEKLSDEEVLKAYKEQQHAERGFRFLKDPLFFAHSMFLKNESRIVAMVMIMGLALMVYSIAERERVTRRDLRHDRHTVSLLTDHIVFSPKYRGKILEGEVAEKLLYTYGVSMITV